MTGMRRVAITGLGLVTPLGCGVDPTWSRLIEGRSGAGPITKFKVDDLPCRIACDVPRGDGSDGTFNPDQWVDPKEQRRVDDFIIYRADRGEPGGDGLRATSPRPKRNASARACSIGSGIGGLDGIEQAAILLHEKGPRKISPFFIPGRLINLASGYVSIRFGYKGPNHCRRDGVLDRRARDRRRGAPDRARRRRRDARGRHRGRDLPDRHRRFRRLPRAVDRFQRHARKRPRAPTTRIATAS